MKIRLLDYAHNEYYVDIPDNTEVIRGKIVSGDMIMTEPIYFDTGERSRTMDFLDGFFELNRSEFNKLNTITKSYDLYD